VPLMAITLTAGAANSGRRHHVFFIFACIADRPVPGVWLPPRPPFGNDRMQRRSRRHFGDARGPPFPVSGGSGVQAAERHCDGAQHARHTDSRRTRQWQSVQVAQPL
jgi:hypothetical protein